MNCLNRLLPGTLLLMVGLLPLATSQARAQSSSATSLLRAGVITLPSAIALPSDTTNTDFDSNYDPLGDLTLPESDLLGVQEVTTLSHGSSGISSGWLIGGALGAAAGIAGLASGGSSAASLIRSPALPVAPAYATELSTAVTARVGSIPSTSGGSNAVTSNGSGIVTSGRNTVTSGGSTIVPGDGNVITVGRPTVGSSNESVFVVPGGGGVSSGAIGPLAFTPEPGSLALLSGMGLVLTAVKVRRRKR